MKGIGMLVIAGWNSEMSSIVIKDDLNRVSGLNFNTLRRYWVHINQ